MSFSIIAAIGKNRELGKSGQLIWKLSEDLKYFKEKTMGHPILMGHKTFDSLPGILPGRKHYVVTRHQALNNSSGEDLALSDQIELVNNLPDFINHHLDDSTEIFVIGGGMIYWEMLDKCDKLYLTEVDAVDPDAETFFPEFDKEKYQRKVIATGKEDDLNYEFVEYLKIK